MSAKGARGLLWATRRWGSNLPAAEKVWNGNYYQRVAEIEAGRPRPEQASQRALQTVKYYWGHTKHGLGDTWVDTKKYFAGTMSKSASPVERMRLMAMRGELLRFLPYSFFILVPFAELLLPFYVWLLPNMTPKYFKTPSALGQSETRERSAQEAAHARLLAHLTKHVDQSALRADAQGQNQLARDRQLAAHLTQNWPRYRDSLGPAGFDLELAQAALDFFRVPHVTGVYVVNQLLNLHVTLANLLYRLGGMPQRLEKSEHRLNVWPLAEARTALLRWQLERHIARLQRTDTQLAAAPAQHLAQLDFFEASRFMAERAIFAPTRENAERQYEQLWLGQPAEDPYLRLWLQVLRRDYAAKAV